MKPWKNVPNETLALNLELWLDMDGRVQSEHQVDFFQEVIWRLRLTSDEFKQEMENG